MSENWAARGNTQKAQSVVMLSMICPIEKGAGLPW